MVTAWLLPSRCSINPSSSHFVMLILARLGQEGSGLSKELPTLISRHSLLHSYSQEDKKMNMWLDSPTVKSYVSLSLLAMLSASGPVLCPP